MAARTWGDVSGATVVTGPGITYPQFYVDDGPTFGIQESDGPTGLGAIVYVPTNAALKAYNVPPPFAGVAVFRQGFNAPGDGGAMMYTFSSSPCTLHGGAGDNGTEVRPSSGTGSWVWVKPPVAHVRVWGGGEGIAASVNSTAFQDMINAAQVQGFAARFSGTSNINTTLNITSPIDLGGLEITDGVFNTTNTTTLAINSDYVNLHDCSFAYSGVTPTGITVSMNNSSGFHGYCRFTNVAIDGFNALVCSDVVTCVLDKLFVSTSHIGITFTITGAADIGDNRVSNSVVVGNTTTVGIMLTNGGGLTILNNKIINHGIGVALALTGPGGSDFFVFNNSIESCTEAGVKLIRSGIGTYQHIMINSNQFSGVLRGVYAPTDGSGTWAGVTIADNMWRSLDTAACTYVDVDSVNGLYAVGGSAISDFPGCRVFNIGSSVNGGYYGGVALSVFYSGSFAASVNAGTNVVGFETTTTPNTFDVTGSITATGSIAAPTGSLYFGPGGGLFGGTVLTVSTPAVNTGYTSFCDNSGTSTIRCGGTNDPTNYYQQGTHYFQQRSPLVNIARFDATGTYNVSSAWLSLSDRSLKEPDHQPYTRGLEAITALNPIVFRYAAGTPFASEDAPSRPLMGLMADEVEPYVPEIVGDTTVKLGKDERETTVSTLEPGNLIYALINSVKELSARLEAVEAKL